MAVKHVPHLISRKTYTRYLALRAALRKLAEKVLRRLADRVVFEGDPPQDWPGVPDSDD